MHNLSVMGFPISRSAQIYKANQAQLEMIKWKRAALEMPDYWLRVIVARYLELFYLKRLDGHPAAETLPIIAESWVSASVCMISGGRLPASLKVWFHIQS